MGCTCHVITKSAGSQKNNKSSDHDSMAEEFCNSVCQKTYVNDFRLRILGKEKVLEKSQIWRRQMLVPSLPSRNEFLVIEVKRYT